MAYGYARGLIAMFVAVLAAPADAHHSVASQYDQNKPVTLRGALTRVEWQSPHVFLHIDVAENGSTTSWAIEYVGPTMLYRAGWKKDTIKTGDIVSVEVVPARNGGKQAYLRTLTTADGRRFGSINGMIVAAAPAAEPRAGTNNR